MTVQAVDVCSCSQIEGKQIKPVRHSELCVAAENTATNQEPGHKEALHNVKAQSEALI
jgi:hypothetical protein